MHRYDSGHHGLALLANVLADRPYDRTVTSCLFWAVPSKPFAASNLAMKAKLAELRHSHAWRLYSSSRRSGAPPADGYKFMRGARHKNRHHCLKAPSAKDLTPRSGGHRCRRSCAVRGNGDRKCSSACLSSSYRRSAPKICLDSRQIGNGREFRSVSLLFHHLHHRLQDVEYEHAVSIVTLGSTSVGYTGRNPKLQKPSSMYSITIGSTGLTDISHSALQVLGKLSSS